MLATVLTNLLSKPATRPYPFVKREPFEDARGSVHFDMEACNFCGLCALRCPAGCIEVDRDEKQLLFEPYRCVMCGACVESCRKACPHMSPVPRPPVREKLTEQHLAPAAVPQAPAV